MDGWMESDQTQSPLLFFFSPLLEKRTIDESFCGQKGKVNHT
jgi:hypothetical protein